MLRFRVGPFPVTLEASFLITAVLLSGFGGLSPAQVALWVGIVFVSVLIHELGHALVGLAYGGRPEIVLQGMGGLTFPNLRSRPRPLKQILLSVAGPLFGLIPGVLAFVALRELRGSSDVGAIEAGSLLEFTLQNFVLTSVSWAALNLLPVLPLDGGHVLEASISGLRGGKPSEQIAAAVSVPVALLVASLAYFQFHQPFVALFLGFMALSNLARARGVAAGAPRRTAPGQSASADDRATVERETAAAREALQAQNVPAALEAAARLEASEAPLLQAAGLRIRAGVELSRGDSASAGLLAGRSFAIWPDLNAAVVAARANLRLGEEKVARTWLTRALEAGAPREAIARDGELAALL